jgi:hypothetical protein
MRKVSFTIALLLALVSAFEVGSVTPASAQTGAEVIALAQGIISVSYKIKDIADVIEGACWHDWVACQFGSDDGKHIILYNRFQRRHVNKPTQENYWFFQGDGDSWSGTLCEAVHWDLSSGSSDREYLKRNYGPITAIWACDDPPQCTDAELAQRRKDADHDHGDRR